MGYPPRFGGADPDGRPLMPARSPNWKNRQGNNEDTETQTGTALRMLMRHHRIGSHLRSSCVPRSRAGGVNALNIESHCGYATVLIHYEAKRKRCSETVCAAIGSAGSIVQVLFMTFICTPCLHHFPRATTITAGKRLLRALNIRANGDSAVCRMLQCLLQARRRMCDSPTTHVPTAPVCQAWRAHRGVVLTRRGFDSGHNQWPPVPAPDDTHARRDKNRRHNEGIEEHSDYEEEA